MKEQVLSDCHTHTQCSSDAADTAAEMCLGAIDRGLSILSITDHCECDSYYRRGFEQNISLSNSETLKAAGEFRGRLRVLSGVELGEPMQDLSAAESALGLAPFDFVLASVHSIPGKKDFYYLDYRAEKIDDLLERYFAEILEMTEWGRFDSLAHLTYPWRYIAGEAGIPIPPGRWSGRIDEVLKALVRRKKALEVNTSGFRQKIGTCLPEPAVLRRYRELGGELVTLGSDAHCRADVGAGIAAGLQTLKEAGFSAYTVYAAHEPIQVPIVQQ